MARQEQAPTRSEEPRTANDHREVYRHPAFGVIRLVTAHGGHTTLFGSDIKHSDRLSIQICEAYLDRSLSNDWIHGRRVLIEFEMSHAQFAQFITSNGSGMGTPITIRERQDPNAPLIDVPAIKDVESKAEMFRREIKDSAKRQVNDLRVAVAKIKELTEGNGSVPKKELKALLRDLEIHSGNLPSNMEYVVGQAEEALEKAQTAAAIQIDAMLRNAVQRAGLTHISQLNQLNQLENKANGSED